MIIKTNDLIHSLACYREIDDKEYVTTGSIS